MRSIAVVVTSAIWCAACGPAPSWSEPSSGTGAEPGPGTEIGAAAGGSVRLGEEATLTVPAGALAEDTVIDIARLSSIPAGPADGFVSFAQGYELSPHGTEFKLASPALLAVRVDGPALAAAGLDPRTVQLFHFDAAAGRYVNVAGTLDSTGTLVAAVEHFSKYVLLAQIAVPGNPGPTVTLQAPIPNLIRAGAPIYLRATVLPAPGTAIAAVRAFYRRLHPAGQPYEMGVMTPDSSPVTPGANTYGFVVPGAVLGAGDLAAGNDFAYYAEATDSLGVTRTLAATPTAQDVTRTYTAGTLTLTPATLDISGGFAHWLPLRGRDNLPSTFQMVSEAVSVTSCPGPDGPPIGVADDQRASGIRFQAVEACAGLLSAEAGGDTASVPVTIHPGKVKALTLYRYEQIGGAEIRTLFDGTYTLSEGHTIELDALGSDAFGNTMPVNVSWQADPAIGTIDDNGRLYALDGNGFGVVTASLGGAGGVSAEQWFNVIGRDWVPKGATLNVHPLAEWVSVSPLAEPRYFHSATRLDDGRVLVAGGYRAGNITLDTAHLYDPATGGWTALPGMGDPRNAHTATLLATGQVLIAGGFVGNSAYGNFRVYDPAANVWSQPAPMVAGRGYHTATRLPNGEVLLAGGLDFTGSSPIFRNQADLFDPVTSACSPAQAMIGQRHSHTATLLEDGRVLVAGGHTGIAITTAAEIYDPALDTWTATAPMATARAWHTATLLPSGEVLVAGGSNGPSDLDSAEIYTPATGSWALTGNDMTAAREEHTATLLPNGTVVVTGGYSNGTSLAGADVYDPATHTWTAGEPMSTERHGHTATLLLGGRVLVTGGYSYSAGALPSAEVYVAAYPAPRPSLAISGTTPYVAWHETDAIANRIYVKRFDGLDWVQDGAGALNVDPTREALFPRITFAGTAPYVAWQEQGPAATQIQVKRWNGGAWVQDGMGSLNVDVTRDATAPAIAASGSTPYVAWQEEGAGASQVFVRRWSGSAWAQLGGSLNQDPVADASAPSIAVTGPTPYVAWQEETAGGRAVYVKHWAGSAWVADGAALNIDAAADAGAPVLVMQGAVPHVAWHETLAGDTQVYVAHWTGAVWLADGPGLANDATAALGAPALGFFDATPYVAWNEGLGGAAQVLVKHRNGAGWIQNDASLNTDVAQDAFPASLALVGSDPYVAWAESAGALFTVHVEALE